MSPTGTEESPFKEFSKFEKNPKSLNLVALDCEMCKTNEGFELTRIAVVDENEKVLLDQYVKPKNPIIDYLTQYSGVTEAHLSNVTTTLEDIHTTLKNWISEDTILVGHSLENDLKALKIVHTKVIDTSVLFPAGEGSKNKLKFLSLKFLNWPIQDGSHDPTQDAIAALKLAKLKHAKGPTYGIPKKNQENLFEVFGREKKKSTFISNFYYCQKYAANRPNTEFSVATSDQEVNDSTLKAIESDSNFILSHYHSVEDKLKDEDTEISESMQSILNSMDEHIHQVHNKLPPNSVLIVFSGQGNMHKAKEYHKKKQTNEWTEEDEKEYEKVIKEARAGLLMLTVSESSSLQKDEAQVVSAEK
eukprot:TRINITY_DN5080_c0_g1_i2.p1 TRINITY_DN5080_c0_g1~~TRINITY_DN5080_c0_g1_i2.p1  ORF type:complete len:360 (-),score=84.28 TRINITY_DN5080_c0_g1_i2:23-1102(-)